MNAKEKLVKLVTTRAGMKWNLLYQIPLFLVAVLALLRVLPTYWLLVALGALAAITLYRNRLISRMLAGALSQCQNACDPVPLAALTGELLSCFCPGGYIKYGRFYRMLLNNRGYALEALGEYEEALAVNRLLEKKVAAMQSPMERAVCYNNIAGNLTLLSRLPEAREALARAQRYAGVFTPEQLGGLAEGLSRTETALKIAEGDITGVEETLKTLLSHDAAINHRAVQLHWQLAQLCALTGEQGKRREALLYVARNGNKLYVARRAAAELAA